MLGWIYLELELPPRVIESLLFNHFFIYNETEQSYYRVNKLQGESNVSSSEYQIRTPDTGV